MPLKRTAKPRKVTSSHKKIFKKQMGRIFEKPLMIVVVTLVLLTGAMMLFKPWQYINISKTEKKVIVVKPSPDLGRGRQMTIDPSKRTLIQIVNRENVKITLDVPAHTTKEKITVKMIPFYYDEKSTSPSMGVIISPANLNFERPVTLSFNFDKTKFKNIAPHNLTTKNIRTTGTSQVMQIDSAASVYTPTLIARGLETERYLPSRILTGGAYVVTFKGEGQVSIAKDTLKRKNMHTLTIIETATVLLFNNKNLGKEELLKAKAAVGKILSKKSPPAQELFAALVLQRKINGEKFSLVKKVYAYDATEGYFQIACKTEGLTVEEYMGFAQAAQLMGHDGIGENCRKKAKNIIAEQAVAIIANPDSTRKEVINALKDVQLVGLDDETNLDQQLTEKFKEVTVKEASKVVQDPDAKPIDAAVELQKLKEAGVEDGPTHDALEKKVTDATQQFDEATNDPNDGEAVTVDDDPDPITLEDDDATIDEEQILYNQGMAAMGVAMLQAFGIEQYDEASMKKMWDEHEGPLTELNDAVYAMCKEFDGEDCDGKFSEIAQKIEEGQRESYRLAEQVGEVQSREYEEPEYLENNGSFELYFEEELTPTPEEGSESNVEGSLNDEEVYEDDNGTMYEYSTNEEEQVEHEDEYQEEFQEELVEEETPQE